MSSTMPCRWRMCSNCSTASSRSRVCTATATMPIMSARTGWDWAAIGISACSRPATPSSTPTPPGSSTTRSKPAPRLLRPASTWIGTPRPRAQLRHPSTSTGMFALAGYTQVFATKQRQAPESWGCHCRPKTVRIENLIRTYEGMGPADSDDGWAACPGRRCGHCPRERRSTCCQQLPADRRRRPGSNWPSIAALNGAWGWLSWLFRVRSVFSHGFMEAV